jgi:hypothetical protein
MVDAAKVDAAKTKTDTASQATSRVAEVVMTLETFKEAPLPDTGFDLAAKRSVWNPKKMAALQGLLLGITHLPSTQEGQKHWTCFVVKLTQPTIVGDPNPAASNGRILEPVYRVAQIGELVLVTATASLRRLEEAANDGRAVFEVYLKFGGKEKTKRGTEVNVYDNIKFLRTVARTAEYRLPTVTIPEMSAGSGNGDGDGEDAIPF